MSILNENDSIVMIIDIQEKLLNSVFNKESLIKKAEVMAKASDMLGIPIIVTEQYPKGLGSTASAIKEVLSENSQVFEKSAFSALDEENIFDYLKASGRTHVIILGIETHICVNQTVNTLIELGYDVSVIKDACGSRDESEHIAGIDRMREDGAHILTVEIALFEILKTSQHPKFKQVQSLIK